MDMDKVLETSLGILDSFLENQWDFVMEKIVAQLGTSVPPQNQDIGVLDGSLESHGQQTHKVSMRKKLP